MKSSAAGFCAALALVTSCLAEPNTQFLIDGKLWRYNNGRQLVIGSPRTLAELRKPFVFKSCRTVYGSKNSGRPADNDDWYACEVMIVGRLRDSLLITVGLVGPWAEKHKYTRKRLLVLDAERELTFVEIPDEVGTKRTCLVSLSLNRIYENGSRIGRAPKSR